MYFGWCVVLISKINPVFASHSARDFAQELVHLVYYGSRPLRQQHSFIGALLLGWCMGSLKVCVVCLEYRVMFGQLVSRLLHAVISVQSFEKVGAYNRDPVTSTLKGCRSYRPLALRPSETRTLHLDLPFIQACLLGNCVRNIADERALKQLQFALCCDLNLEVALWSLENIEWKLCIRGIDSFPVQLGPLSLSFLFLSWLWIEEVILNCCWSSSSLQMPVSQHPWRSPKLNYMDS